MGACKSIPSDETLLETSQVIRPPSRPDLATNMALTFTEFSLECLKVATKNFKIDNVVTEGNVNASNVVYKGRLNNGMWIAVKKFTKRAWHSRKKFVAEARAVGKLRHKRLANLIGYCCEGDERLLVAEYMVNGTLPKHLFTWENRSIVWPMRLRVVLCTAQALLYCQNNGRPLYYDLNAYRILFDEDGDPCLSCFGLMKNSCNGKGYSMNFAHTPPEYQRDGTFTTKSVIHSFGNILLYLLTGEHTAAPNHVLSLITSEYITRLMDKNLNGNFSTGEATLIVGLVSQCLRDDPGRRPSLKDLNVVLAQLDFKCDVPSYELLGLLKQEEAQLTPMGDACSRMDLLAIHEILVEMGYGKNEETNMGASFSEWTQQRSEKQDGKLQGDDAFSKKDFKSAIDFYSKFINNDNKLPTVYARRSICFLVCNLPDNALHDAMLAERYRADWPIALYLQSVALIKRKMENDAKDMLDRATLLEKKQNGGSAGAPRE